MRLADKVIEFLKMNPEERFTAREISEWVWKTYPNECHAKMERSKATVQPANDKSGLIQQLVAEIGSHHKRIIQREPRIRTTEGRPRKYYFTEKTIEEEVKEISLVSHAEPSPDKSDKEQQQASISREFTEHDLYPLLSRYLISEFSVFSKRIDEKRSRNSKGAGGNHWLFPDLVGLEDLSSNWSSRIQECAREYGSPNARLWSFEVKLHINMSNVRECFFQAASNSSWANYSYLVASEISGKDTVLELQTLCQLHDLGLILLNPQSPTDSELLIPASETEVDWNSANRLAEENSDFSVFVSLVSDFHKLGKVYADQWDAEIDDEEV
jgi:hypothetical protein